MSVGSPRVFRMTRASGRSKSRLPRSARAARSARLIRMSAWIASSVSRSTERRPSLIACASS